MQVLAHLHQPVSDEHIQGGEGGPTPGEHVRERNLQVSVPVPFPKVPTLQLAGSVQRHPAQGCDDVRALQASDQHSKGKAHPGDDALSGEGLLLFDPVGACPQSEGGLYNGEASAGDAVGRWLEKHERADDPEATEEQLDRVDYLGTVLDPLEDGLLALVRVEGILGVEARGIAAGARYRRSRSLIGVARISACSSIWLPCLWRSTDQSVARPTSCRPRLAHFEGPPSSSHVRLVLHSQILRKYNK